MARLFRMPEVAAGTAEAILASWSVAENSPVTAAEPIATVETDKAAVDIEADADATVLKVLVDEGTTVPVGAPIAVLAEPGEVVHDVGALLAQLVGASPAPGPASAGAPEPAAPHSTPTAAQPVAAAPGSPARADAPTTRIFASPLARKRAAEAGLGIGEITASGPGGRIVRRDVEAAIARRGTPPPPATPAPHAATGPATSPCVASDGARIVPPSRMRRAIATRLTQSKQSVPHFYLRGVCRVGKLLALREELNTTAPVRISVNDLVIKAAARAHGAVPELNVCWEDDGIRSFDTVDIATAVTTSSGLLAPVLRSVDSLSISALARQTRDLATRAKEGALRPAELDGGTLTVTNLGMFGTEEFTAIINPPQAAILAVGAARDEAVVDDGRLSVSKVMRVTLSVDHRPVDGVNAAHWMRTFVSLIENPLKILA
jgi:pyruvate dehydrogenase E2 component (dihydrolipoamide acetyltransferase)